MSSDTAGSGRVPDAAADGVAAPADAPQARPATPPLLPQMRVDPAWYRSRHDVVARDLLREPGLDLDRHFRERGQFLALDPNPFFLLSHYVRESGYHRRRPPYGPCEDYLRNAGQLQASAHWLFDEAWVQRLNPKLGDAVAKGNWISAYLYFLRQPKAAELSPHPLFNPTYYRRIAGLDAGDNPFRHFLTTGQAAGLSPHPLFDAAYYALVAGSADGAALARYESPFHHFVARGMARGLVPLPDFDAEHYVNADPAAADAVRSGKISAFRHFLDIGQAKGQAPNPRFSAGDYRWYNPGIDADIAELGLASPFEHFIAIGAAKRLRASRPLHTVKLPAPAAKGLFEQRARIAAQLHCRDGLAFPPAADPAVSFIVPVWNNFAFTMALLGQLREACAASAAEAEVVVVDNGSSDLTTDLARFVSGVTVLRSEQQLGYVKACNRGAAAARGAFLVFLNNDIELTPGLIDRLVQDFAVADVGICGARIVGAGGTLQEAGSVLLRDGHGIGFGRGGDPAAPQFLFPRDVDYVSGCFLAIRRALFRDLGGFDERFSPGYYEDTDLCLQARRLGHRVLYDPRLVIYHYEYASYSDGRPSSLSTAQMHENHGKFVAKNAAILQETVGRRDAEGSSLAFHLVPSQRPVRVLYVEDRIPQAVRGSGFTASADILADMVAAGANVAVWSLHERGEMPFPLWRGGIHSLLPARDGEETLAAHLASRGDDYDVVWVCRTHNYVALRQCLYAWRAERRDRRLVVDTEALASLRRASLQERIGEAMAAPDLIDSVRAELPQIAGVDHVVAKNGVDAAMLAAALGVDAAVLGHRFAARRAAPGPEGRSGILFVGAIYGEDTPNYDSLRWFIGAVLPELRRTLPDVVFHVAGYQGGDVAPIATPPGAAVVWHGAVTDLCPLFDGCRVFVAPTRYAGGLPHKLQNAIAHGLPSVCTPLLHRQLEDDADGPCVLSPPDWSAEAFAGCVARLYGDADLWRLLQARGFDYIERRCSPAAHMATIRRLIGGR